MADKVQKIREEVERLQSRAEYNFGISLTENTRQFWLGESNVLTIIGKYIGTMQKEPVKIKKGCKYRCLSDMINRDTGNIAFIGDNIYFAPKDNTLVSEEYGLLCDTSEDASNFELVEEPKECMFTKDYYTDEDRKVLCDGCEEECRFNKKEDSASDELEKVVEEIVDPTVLNAYGVKEIANRLRRTMIESANNEQVKELTKTQHIKETCKENGNSLTQEPISDDLEQAIDTYLATYFGGEKEKQDWPFLKKMAIHFAKWQKEQMMAKAVDGRLCSTICGSEQNVVAYVGYGEYGKDGDKVKVILIKE